MSTEPVESGLKGILRRAFRRAVDPTTAAERAMNFILASPRVRQLNRAVGVVTERETDKGIHEDLNHKIEAESDSVVLVYVKKPTDKAKGPAYTWEFLKRVDLSQISFDADGAPVSFSIDTLITK